MIQPIKFISINMDDYDEIVGIRLSDVCGNKIVEKTWGNSGEWQIKEIPDGLDIISVRCNTKADKDHILRIGFMLWSPNPDAVD